MHSFDLRVYYEDTDLAGIVYYANYLKFIERGRSEWIRALGMDQARLRAEKGMVFAVRRLLADYLRPAHFEDMLQVRTTVDTLGGASLTLDQQVWRGDQALFTAKVTLVCIAANGLPTRLPQELRDAI